MFRGDLAYLSFVFPVQLGASRYTTRALFRSLDAKLYGADWAATEAFENVQNWRGDVALAERGCRPGSEFGTVLDNRPGLN